MGAWFASFSNTIVTKYVPAFTATSLETTSPLAKMRYSNLAMPQTSAETPVQASIIAEA